MVSRWCVVSIWFQSAAHKNTACPCYRTYRADRCVPAADSDPDQAGPESHGQGSGARQVDCICIIYYPSIPPRSTHRTIRSTSKVLLDQGASVYILVFIYVISSRRVFLFSIVHVISSRLRIGRGMSTRFIIPAAPSPLLPAPSLSLLPFSLGPAHAPYTDNHATTPQYFQPRPLGPPPHHGRETVRATFRGRLVIGQYLAVPPAYRGIILSTSLPPNKGGTEHHAIVSDAPLTPSASIDTVEDDTGGRSSTRSSTVGRIKGAGQIALSKPRTRRTAPKKRTVLDSDDDIDNHHDEVDEQDGDRPSRRSKRVRTMTTPEKNAAVPEIVVQQATPLKQPPCSPPIVRDGHLDLRPTLMEEDTRIAVEEVNEPFIPSPETGNDSSVFSSPLVKQDNNVKEEYDGPVRILYPKAQFQGFMLYTGDGPLVGFREDELEKREQQVGAGERRQMNESQSESQSQSQSQAQTETSLESDSQSNINLRPSWWRQGGAGEGGDEFVRGMGEWLGLVQVVSLFPHLFLSFLCAKD